MADAVDAVLELWRAERPDLDPWPTGIVGRIGRLARVLDREQRAYLAEHDLEVWEFDVLATLRRSGPPYELTAGALIKAALVSSGAITKRMDRLEKRGLIERIRDDADRRSVKARLTPRGHEVVDEVFPAHIRQGERLLASLPPEERDHLAATLRGLLEALGDTSLD
ncbi:MarR family winged helix-turn-helix transcriptional regulator [Actinomadura gamaensis]|uniref:MarR family winged helix-turn-helix transcriptional regulator n=1 Tax=Actinomadura gamaensis TaxID=1763541 RepID=A0ABV9U5T0_9ACTN